jgi:drug/metabolite transporter (DMT)-like permease
MNAQSTPKVSRALVIAAFAIVYVVWGSTYLAIRVVVETLPPFLSGGSRFVFAGALLYLFLKLRGFQSPTRSQWRHSTVTGLLLLVGGNGLVMWAEKSVPSGLAALIIALTPVWFVLLEWLRPRGVRPDLRTIVGVVIGFAGVLMLVSGRADRSHTAAHWWGAAAILTAGLSWAGGSLYSKHTPNTGSPWMNAAAQMICGGAGLLVCGVLFGEPFRTNWAQVSGRSLFALAYLVVFGSWIAFSAYVWLLQASTPARISTYAYVNPVIAVFLGWLVLGEAVTPRIFGGALVILAGVITITLPKETVAGFVGRLWPVSAR